MNIYVALGIILGVMIAMGAIAMAMFLIIEARNKKRSTASMPKGGDSTATGRMLQDKYKQERDNGEFKRPDFY